MRLISLELEGFGSFAGHETIDFSVMNGLWLVTGDTGAGKTTLFDAIAFALFGTASGTSRTDRTSRGLRSDYLSDDAASYVRLTFEQEGKTWTVERTPAYRKAKNKNDTPETAILTGEKESFEKPTQVNRRIEELLRMDVSQFRQLVMIAQNDFENLVTGKGEEREKILRSLLGTDRIERFQDVIRAEKNRADTELKGALAQLQQEAAAFSWDEEARREEAVQLYLARRGTPDVQVSEALTDAMRRSTERLREAIDAAEKAREPYEARRSGLEKRHGAAQQLHARFAELRRTQEAVRQDEEEKNARESERQDLLRREAAFGLLPQKTARDSARTNRTLKAAALEEAAKAAEKAAAQSAAAEQRAQDIPALEEAARQKSAEADGLKARLPAFIELREKERQLEAARRAEETADAAVRALETDIEKAQERTQAMKTQAAGEPAAARQTEAAKARCAETAKRIQALHDLVREEERAVQGERAVTQKRADAERTWQIYKDVHERFLQDEYAVVVKELRPGAPCPICGSTEHPAPYMPKADRGASVTAAEDTAAHDAHEQEKTLLERYRAGLDEIRRTIGAKREALGLTGGTQAALTAAEAEDRAAGAAKETAEKAYAAAHEAALQLRDAENALAGLREKEAGIRQAAADAKAAVSRLAGECAQLRAVLPPEGEEAIRAKIAALTGEAEKDRVQASALRDAESRARTEAAGCTVRLQGAAANLEEAGKRLRESEADLLRAMTDHAFADEDALTAALTIPQATVRTRQEALTRLLQDAVNRREQLTKLQAELKDRQDADPDAIAAQIAEAVGKIEALDRALQALRDTYTQCAGTAERTRMAYARWREAAAKAQLYGTLYRTALGARGGNNTFEVYIQRVWFRQVIELANLRFRPMTGGMFELRLNDTNLELNVMDFRTGRERPTGTLSGGEKFKAALSMALGMSDMVQSRLGSVHLGMLFIDEGFGTLDADSIGLAVDILRRLSDDTGRLVAVISHREEMRSGIEHRLLVRKHKEGGASKGSYIAWEL